MRPTTLFGIIILALLSIPAVSAVECVEGEICDLGIIADPTPNITVDFNEHPIFLITNPPLLYDIDGNNYSIRASNPTLTSGFHTVWYFEPESYLINNTYYFFIYAVDDDENEVNITAQFVVDAPYMDIRLVEPRLGISTSRVFNITVETEFATDCKLGPYGFMEYPNLLDWFSALGREFDGYPEDSILHEVKNFSDVNPPGNPLRYIILCNQSGRIHPKSLYLGYDGSAPSVNVGVRPDPLVDPGNRQVEVTVATDDHSLCRYGHNHSRMMDITPYDSTDYYAYRTQHVFNISYNFITASYDLYPGPWDFPLFVACENLAGLEGNASRNIRVDFTQPLTITLLSDKYSTERAYKLEVQTNMQANCSYELDGTTNFLYNPSEQQYLYHYRDLSLDEGRHDIDVVCLDLFNTEGRASFTIVIDRTAPSRPDIDAKDPTCSLSRMRAEFEANDTLSDIYRFNYTITGPDVDMDWELSSKNDNPERIEVDDLDLEEDEDYKWRVKAIDRAGNEGPIAEETVLATSSSAPACDDNPPSVKVNKWKDDGDTYANLTCRDAETACADNFIYGLAKKRVNCEPEETRGYADDPILIEESYYLCYDAYDIRENHVGGIEFIKVTVDEEDDTCENGVLDGDETDIDCGGLCPELCEDGDDCLYDIDCYSSYCDQNNTCATPSCTDGVRNGDETGIDCGGSCPDACGAGGECETALDCDDGYLCQFNECVRDRALDTDGDGIPDYWEEEYFDCIDCADPDDDPDDDGHTNLEEYLGDTDPTDPTSHPEDESNLFALILLILGIILVLAGAGYLLYDQYRPKEETGYEEEQIALQNELGARPSTGTKEEEEPIPLEDTESYLKKKKVSRDRQKRKLLSAFEDEEPSKEKPSEQEGESGQGKENKDEIDLLAAKKETDKEEKKPFPKKQAGKGTQRASTAKKQENMTREDVQKDVFAELEGLAKGRKGKPEPKRKGAKTSPETSKPPTGKTPQKEQKMSQQDVFDKLAELSGKSSEHIQDVMGDKKRISAKDMVNIFADVSSKKQLDTDVFKAILSQLLSGQKISRRAVSDILFEFLDQELLAKQEVTAIMKELNLI